MKIGGQTIKAGEVVQLDPNCLKLVGVNRKVNELHVRGLKKTMAEENLLHLNPLKVNEKLEVIDGQHRLTAARELGMKSVTCLVVAGTVHDAIKLNLNQKNWGLMDFAHYWAEQGRKAYRDYIEFCGLSGMQPSVAMGLMMGTEASGGGSHTDDFRRGSFKVKNTPEKLYDFIDLLDSFKPFLDKGTRARPFIIAFWRVYSSEAFQYDHKRMLHKLEIIGKMTRRVETKAYLEQFETIYNWKVAAQNKVRFL